VAIHQLSFSPSVLQKDGPQIYIEVSAPSDEIRDGTAVGLEYPRPFGIRALIDTGASLTVVNPQVVTTCKLRHTGFATVASVAKVGKYPQHAAWIRFPGTKLAGLDGVAVVACEMIKQPYACLIGRDILRNWLLTYSGDGTVSVQELR